MHIHRFWGPFTFDSKAFASKWVSNSNIPDCVWRIEDHTKFCLFVQSWSAYNWVDAATRPRGSGESWRSGPLSKSWINLGALSKKKRHYLGIFPKRRTPPPPFGNPLSKHFFSVYFAFYALRNIFGFHQKVKIHHPHSHFYFKSNRFYHF